MKKRCILCQNKGDYANEDFSIVLCQKCANQVLIQKEEDLFVWFDEIELDLEFAEKFRKIEEEKEE